MKLKPIVACATNYLRKNKPQVLTGVGVVLHAASLVAAIKGTSDFKDEIAEIRKNREVTRKDIAIGILKHYTAMGLCFAGGTGSSICAVGTAIARAEAAATAATIAATNVKDIKDSIEQVVGPKKAEEVKSKVAEKQTERANPGNAQIFVTGRGNQLFYDPNWGLFFRSNMDSVRKAVNKVNESRLDGNEICVSDFMYNLGLDYIPNATDGFGWDPMTTKLEIDYESKFIPELDESAILLEYEAPLLHPEYYGAPSRSY